MPNTDTIPDAYGVIPDDPAERRSPKNAALREARDVIEATDGITVAKEKPWYESKTLWTAVAVVVTGAYDAYAKTHGLSPIPEYIYVVLGMFGIYARASGNSVIKK